MFVSPRQIGQRHQVQQPGRRPVQARLRDHVELSRGGEDRAARAIQIAREGIEDHAFAQRRDAAFGRRHHDRTAARAEDLRAEHPAEIASPEVRRRHRRQARAVHPFERAFPVREEEHLVPADGTAEAAAVDVAIAAGLSVTPARFSSQRNARSLLLSCSANALPRKSFVPDFVITVIAGAARHALLGVEVVRRDVHFLDALHRRDVHGVMRHRDEDVGRSVHARIVRAALLAVDVGRQRAPRRIRHGVLKARGRGAGHEIDQRLIVPVVGQRHVLHGPRVQVDADIRLRRLEDRARRIHGDALRERAHLDRGVDARDGIDGDADAALRVGLEPARADRQVVGPFLQVGNRVVAFGVRRRLA